MIIYPDDRVLVAVMNNKKDWQRVLDEGWYRIPVKHAPEGTPDFDYIAFYQTKAFGSDKWAIHYYARIEGHELLTRKDLLPSEPNHRRANNWYYKLQLGPLQHKLPPIISRHWRRITFIVTTGDRFEAAEEINDLFEDQSPVGRLYVTLKEIGIHAERNLPLKEKGIDYVVDLAVPVGDDQWLPVMLTPPQDVFPDSTVLLSPDRQTADWVKVIQQELAKLDQ
jgi:hypothetical protein